METILNLVYHDIRKYQNKTGKLEGRKKYTKCKDEKYRNWKARAGNPGAARTLYFNFVCRNQIRLRG